MVENSFIAAQGDPEGLWLVSDMGGPEPAVPERPGAVQEVVSFPIRSRPSEPEEVV